MTEPFTKASPILPVSGQGSARLRQELADLEDLVKKVLVEDFSRLEKQLQGSALTKTISPAEIAAERIVRRIREVSQLTRGLEPGRAEQTLDSRRRYAADQALETHDFGATVEGYKAWAIDGDEWSIEVFLADTADQAQVFFNLSFPPGSATPWEMRHRVVTPEAKDPEPMP